MIPSTIAIIPEVGYNPYYNSSIKAQQWLSYFATKHRVHVQHAKNGREYQVGKYFLDGAIIDSNGQLDKALQFHGCLYHGCQKCFHPESLNPIKQEKMIHTHQRHVQRINFIKSQVPELVEIWECDFDQMKRSEPDLERFISQLEFRERINPRDALFGGRTNASKLYYKINENERILHYDFTSLYPSVQKYFRFPIVHPKIITENFSDINSYFGLVKCRILPPKKLFFPVLPCRSHHKLVFTLCKKCAEHQSNKSCVHSDSERMMEGTWCSVEIQEAIRQGYIIDKLFEVWNYEKSDSYDESTKQGGLFTSYINSFLKIKQEASGFPRWVKNDQDKESYKQLYYQKEGIQLDLDKCQKKPRYA